MGTSAVLQGRHCNNSTRSVSNQLTAANGTLHTDGAWRRQGPRAAHLGLLGARCKWHHNKQLSDG